MSQCSNFRIYLEMINSSNFTVHLTCSNGTMSSSRTDWKSPPARGNSIDFISCRDLNVYVYKGICYNCQKCALIPGAYSSTRTISCWFWKTSFRWTILFESETGRYSSYFEITITISLVNGHHHHHHHGNVQVRPAHIERRAIS